MARASLARYPSLPCVTHAVDDAGEKVPFAMSALPLLELMRMRPAPPPPPPATPVPPAAGAAAPSIDAPPEPAPPVASPGPPAADVESGVPFFPLSRPAPA